MARLKAPLGTLAHKPLCERYLGAIFCDAVDDCDV